MQVLKKIMARLILFSLLSTNKILNLMKNETKLDENEYKADFAISENYIKFSSELLRLSLLAITAYGIIFMKEIVENNPNFVIRNNNILIVSMLFFFVSTFTSLFHRYYATDAMTWFIQWRRYLKNNELTEAEKERKGLKRMLNRSRFSLIFCEASFALGVLSFIAAVLNVYLKASN